MAILLDPHTWLTLVILTFLELILGGDNIVFITIAASKLPPEQQSIARRLGLVMALFTRLIFLAFIVALVGLTKPVFNIATHAVSLRDIIFILGGLFLIYKSTDEIIDTRQMSEKKFTPKYARFGMVIAQIMLFDVIFSIDSVMTAVGIAKHYFIMAAAIIIAVIMMIIASDFLSKLVNSHPRIKLLAICFLCLIGLFLIIEGLGIHVPRIALYMPLGFALFYQLTLVYCKAL